MASRKSSSARPPNLGGHVVPFEAPARPHVVQGRLIGVQGDGLSEALDSQAELLVSAVHLRESDIRIELAGVERDGFIQVGDRLG